MERSLFAALLFALTLSLTAPASAQNGQAAYPLVSDKSNKFESGRLYRFVEANGLPAVIVDKGGRAAEIAEAVRMSTARFQRLNDMSAYDPVQAEQVYYLKAKYSKGPIGHHVLQAGETVWDVAQKYALQLPALLEKNRLTYFAKLEPGRKLYLQRTVGPEEKPEYDESVAEAAEREEERAAEEEEQGDSRTRTFVVGEDGQTFAVSEERGGRSTRRGGNDSRFGYERDGADEEDEKGLVHVVQPGETIYDLSLKYNVTVLDLIEYNRRLPKDLSLKPGKKVVIRPERGASTYMGDEYLRGGGVYLDRAGRSRRRPEDLTAGSYFAGTQAPEKLGAYKKYGDKGGAGLVKAKPSSKKTTKRRSYSPRTNKQDWWAPSPFEIQQVFGIKDLSEKDSVYHVVEPGETIYSVVRFYDLDFSTFLRWNDFDKNTGLIVGQKVFIVDPASVGLARPKSGERRTHTVKKGETLYSIARAYALPAGKFMDWNGKTNQSSLYIGETLYLDPPPAPRTEETQPPRRRPESPAPDPNKEYRGEFTYYTVQSGDTEYSICREFGIPRDQFREWNRLEEAADLQVGQKLIIDKQVKSIGAKVPPPRKARVHTVVSGDALSPIAKKYGVSMDEIREWNGLTSNVLFRGQKLTVGYASIVPPSDEQIAAKAAAEAEARRKAAAAKRAEEERKAAAAAAASAAAKKKAEEEAAAASAAAKKAEEDKKEADKSDKKEEESKKGDDKKEDKAKEEEKKKEAPKKEEKKEEKKDGPPSLARALSNGVYVGEKPGQVTEAGVYTVKEGDTLAYIADLFDLTVIELRSLNNNVKSSEMEAGMKLKIRE